MEGAKIRDEMKYHFWANHSQLCEKVRNNLFVVDQDYTFHEVIIHHRDKTLCIELSEYKLLGFFAMMKGNWFKLADSPPVKRNVANLVPTISYMGLTKRIAIRLIRPTLSSV